MASIKNVGTTPVENIVKEREKNGEYKTFDEFCERVKDKDVNRKCIESLIKAGVFEGFNQTRATLLASFENIMDIIYTSNKNSIAGQVSMFDLGDSEQNDIKYTYNVREELNEKDLLTMEKEMLGLYISGHPLEKMKLQIEETTNINTMKILQIKEEIDSGLQTEYKDGTPVRYAGIISSIKKKYTKTNKIMAFITIEDLYGQNEVIVFENCYQKCTDALLEDNIVLVEGRLSIKEDDNITIIASSIKNFKSEQNNIITINIANMDENTRKKLKGLIRFFNGEKNNVKIQVIDKDGVKP